MPVARCYKCGLTIRGVWRNGPPKNCPKCGFGDSDKVIQAQLYQARLRAMPCWKRWYFKSMDRINKWKAKGL